MHSPIGEQAVPLPGALGKNLYSGLFRMSANNPCANNRFLVVAGLRSPFPAGGGGVLVFVPRGCHVPTHTFPEHLGASLQSLLVPPHLRATVPRILLTWEPTFPPATAF